MTENFRQVLIVGGYHDGERVEVDVNAGSIQLTERPPLSSWPVRGSYAVSFEYRTHWYKRMPWHATVEFGGRAHERFIYHDPNLSSAQVLDRLISGYVRS